MKIDDREDKLDGATGSFLIIKLLFLVIGIPVLVPALGLLLQAVVWHCLFSRIEGIVFNGGWLEAYALSLALACCSLCLNFLLIAACDLVRKLRGQPVEKSSRAKLREVASWSDVFKALPGAAIILREVFVYAVSLLLLTGMEPVRLHFYGILQIVLAAGVLSAVWIIFMTGMSLAVYGMLLREQRSRAAQKNIALP